MKRLLENIAYALGGLVLLAAAVAYFFWQGADRLFAFLIVAGVLLLMGAWGVFAADKRDGVTYFKSTKKPNWRKGESLTTELPFDSLRKNFLTMIRHDADAVVADKDYLSWNSGSFADIRLERRGQQDWVGLFWVNAEHGMADVTMRKLCETHGLAMPDSFRRMKPHGLVFYTSGTLTLYPATLAEEFKADFLDTVLSQGRDFDRWVQEYDEE